MFSQSATQKASHKSGIPPVSQSTPFGSYYLEEFPVTVFSSHDTWTHTHIPCRHLQEDTHMHKLAKWLLLLSLFVTPCFQTSSSASPEVSHLFHRCFLFQVIRRTRSTCRALQFLQLSCRPLCKTTGLDGSGCFSS